METRSKTRKRGRVQHCCLDAKNKPIAIEPDVQFISEKHSNGWADLPILILEKIIALDKGQHEYHAWESNYLHKLKKYADVCSQWRNGIMLSKRLFDRCRHYNIYTCSEHNRSLVKSGFLSALENITIGEMWEIGRPDGMDHLSFVRNHINNNITSLTTFSIKIKDKTNIRALIELLAMSPNASTFTLMFHQSSLGVQQRAEQYWKILLIVFYCNANDKTITIEHNDRCELTSPDWSFINKPKFKRYKICRTPGVIKNLIIKSWPGSYGLFQTAPDWNHSSILFDRVTIYYASKSFINYMSDIKSKCVQLRLFQGIWVPNNEQLYQFKHCDKLELFFMEPSRDSHNRNIDAMKLFQHPNTHVLLEKPFEVVDACPRHWRYEDNWKRADVDNFVSFIATSSMKTLTYTIEKYSDTGKTVIETVTFKCDEHFATTFMAFLETQPIYVGNNYQNFVTLESARKSFL